MSGLSFDRVALYPKLKKCDLRTTPPVASPCAPWSLPRPFFSRASGPLGSPAGSGFPMKSVPMFPLPPCEG